MLTAAVILCVLVDQSFAFPQLVLNASVLSRQYDGFGGLSGGGATSRLLPDYPEPHRSDVLDMLFKPFFGVSAHILKVEVGGDTFSGCGTEPSHRRADDDLSFTRGYEWWLMRQAASRNPSILGYALPWGFSAWVGEGNGGYPLNERQASYMQEFCTGAATVGGGWNCDYAGIWNEQAWSVDYVIRFRNALDAAGLNNTRIIVHDEGGDQEDVLQALTDNSTFAQAVYAIGVHYPRGSNSSAGMQESGLPLWSSEDSSTYFDGAGGACLARIQSWNWLYGQYSSITIWNLVTSYYDHLYWYGDSLLSASYPWSGSWTDVAPTWAAAHWSQFAWPGWAFLPSSIGRQAGVGGSGLLPGGGTYVTLVDPTSVSAALDAHAALAWTQEQAQEAQEEKANDKPNKEVRMAELRRDAHVRHFAKGQAFQGKGAQDPSSSSSSSMHWSLIIETTTPANSRCIRSNPPSTWTVVDTQDVSFTLADGLIRPPTVVLWKSVFAVSAHEPTVSWFQRLSDVPVDPVLGNFTLLGLHPDCAYTVTSMDRGQRHGTPASAPPTNVPFPSAPEPYTDNFSAYANDSMPAYWSDMAGSWAVRPSRDGGPNPAFEQAVTSLSVGWHAGDDSLHPLTIIGDWNASVQDLNVSVWIQDSAAPGGGGGTGDPLPSLLLCNASDTSQQWTWNATSTSGLPGSVLDGLMAQCLDVFGCDGAPGTPVWMWPCVNSSGGGGACDQSNQQWSLQSWGGGQLVTRMPDGQCLTVVPSYNSTDGDSLSVLANSRYTLQMLPCLAGAACLSGQPLPWLVQSWAWDPATLALSLSQPSDCSTPTGWCLSSTPPRSLADTHVGIGLRVGGSLPTSTVARAYSSDWFSYGYWCSVSDTGVWAVLKGGAGPGEPSEEEARDREVGRMGTRGRGSTRARVHGVDNRIVLATGQLTAGSMSLRSWHTLRCSVTQADPQAGVAATGAVLSAWWDGSPLVQGLVDDGSAHGPVFPVGWAALTSGWHIAQFTNLSLLSSQ